MPANNVWNTPDIGSGLFNRTTPNDARQESSGAGGVVIKAYVVDGVDKHFARANAEGVKIIAELPVASRVDPQRAQVSC